MKIRTKYLLFIGIIHGAALVMSYLIFRQNKVFFIISEAFILLSVALSWSLYKDLIRPVQMLAGGAEALRDRDFSVKLIHTGSPEMDQLVDVYNRMIEQLRQERVLQQEQHLFLEKLLHHAPLSVLIFNYDGQPDYINPAAADIFGVAMPLPPQKLQLPFDHPLLRHAKDLPPGESVVIQTETAQKFKLSKTSFIDRGFLRHFVLIEELTAEILAAEKSAYGKVIRMMAHEVNNSLGAVNSILDIAHQHVDDRPIQQALRTALKRNEQLSRFMRRFADVIRLPDPRREDFDLHVLLHNCATLMEHLAAKKSIRFQFDLHPEPCILSADRQQMEQVLINVIKNAIESIEQEGIILLRTTFPPVRLQIIDNGKGISPEAAHLLFSPFFTTKNGGQGVGLTLIREILTRHQYAFSLQTQPDGTTVFEIRC